MARNRNTSLALFLAAVCLSASSCAPASVHPLSDDKTSTRDDRLVGRWRAVDPAVKDGEANVTISKSKDSGMRLDVVIKDTLPGAPKEQNEQYASFLYTTTIDSQWYMTISTLAAETEKKLDTFTILHYGFLDKDTLEVRLMDDGKIAAAIRAKELRGTVKTKKETAYLFAIIPIGYKTEIVTISDSPEAIARFLKKHGRDCFDAVPLVTLKREK
jgi:hypothetical protein